MFFSLVKNTREKEIVTVHGGGLAGHGPATCYFFRWVLAAKPPAPSEQEDSRGPDGPRSPRWGYPLNA